MKYAGMVIKERDHQWHGGRIKATVWDVAKTNTSNLHPTMKPTALAEIACENSTKKGDSVLDLFGGSGSTLIACEKLGRKCFMMELDNTYVDVIIKRYQNYTGKDAIHEEIGKTWNQLSQEMMTEAKT